MYSAPDPRDPDAVDPGRAVVEAVAAAEGVAPIALEPTLGSVIDVDALNELFEFRDRTNGRVAFNYHGYRVTVDSDGRVTVEPVDESP